MIYINIAYLNPGSSGKLWYFREGTEREVAGVDIELVRLQTRQKFVLFHFNIQILYITNKYKALIFSTYA